MPLSLLATARRITTIAHFLQGWNVHATARKESDLASFPAGVSGHLLDVQDRAQIERVAAAFGDQPIDLLVHNAGVGKDASEELIMKVNVEAPFHIVDALFPAISKSQLKKIAILSSQLGSRQRFGGGDVPKNPYGASKCYLNDRFRVEEPKWRQSSVASVSVHPGWVQTDMGGAAADITVEESVDGMYKVFQELNTDNSGRFLTYAGIEHPW